MTVLRRVMAAASRSVLVGVLSLGIAQAGGTHSGPHGKSGKETLEQMKKMHQGHEHGHDFKALEAMTPEQSARVMKLMSEVGIALPPMDSRRGRDLFMSKGCILCHRINGVGREVGPDLDAAKMPSPMNAFEFAARMWKGAPAMVAMQQDELGDVIALSGQDLADLVAFVHDNKEQKTVSKKLIPKRWKKKIAQ